MKSEARESSATLRVVGVLLLASPILVMRLASACQNTPACFEGDYVECRCIDETWGYAACDAKAEAFGECVCDGTTPGVGVDQVSGAASSGAASSGAASSSGSLTAGDGP